MKRYFTLHAMVFFAVFSSIILQGCKTQETPLSLINVDFSLEYPVMDLKISDIADISYIPLGGKDSARLLTPAQLFKNRIYIDDSLIFIGDFAPYRKDGEWNRYFPQKGKLVMFSTAGKYLGTVFKAQDNKEDILFGLRAPYEVDSDSKEIYAFSEYGRFMRAFNYSGEILSSSGSLQNEKYRESALLGDTLVLFDINSQYISSSGQLRNRGAIMQLYDIRSGKFVPHKGIHFARPGNINLIFENSITHTTDGLYIITERTDTVYHINRKLEITPIFTSVQHFEDARNMVCPLVETEDYILFCNSLDSVSKRNKRFRNANYIYMKAEGQIYQLPCSNSFPEDEAELLWKDEFLLNSSNLTKTPNTLVSVLPITLLKEKYNLLPDNLKRITDTASEEDNPVLMVIRFGKRIY